MANLTGSLDVIGLGIAQAVLGPEARAALDAADVLAGGRRLLQAFPDHPGERLVLGRSAPDAAGEPAGLSLNAFLDALGSALRRGSRVAVLADGDPLFFGIGQALAERFGPEGLRFHPAVCAVQTASARLKRPWQDTLAVSLHGRDDPAPLLAALAHRGAAFVLTDAASSPDRLAGLLLDQGLDEAVLTVCEDLGLPGERLLRLAPAEAARRRFSPLNVLLVEAPPRPGLTVGRPDDAYRRQAGLITKGPARACALAALRPAADSTLWDVGAGSGAVSIEACALLPRGRVFAVERHPERIATIRENVRTFGAWQVCPVEGQAPDCLAALPDPDRIFLGGGLAGDGGDLLDALCARLAPGGRIAANTVLLDSLGGLLRRFQSLGWPVEARQVQAALFEPLAGDVRLAAQNPVFIVAADKPSRDGHDRETRIR